VALILNLGMEGQHKRLVYTNDLKSKGWILLQTDNTDITDITVYLKIKTKINTTDITDNTDITEKIKQLSITKGVAHVGWTRELGAGSPAGSFSSGDENATRSPTQATPPAVMLNCWTPEKTDITDTTDITDITE
jgi:hypothetical protein